MEQHGFLVIDKPAGMTSHDVVQRVRRALRMQRVGHTGTLDPIATGVLVLCVGKAVRLQRFLMARDKEYRARVRLGFATDTYDALGKPTTPLTSTVHLSEADIERVLAEFRGEYDQIPPMYSAKKKGGIRLYALARRGQSVERSPIRVRIDVLELVEDEGAKLRRCDDGTTEFTLRVRCSAGTYVRALAHDIGQRLGCGAYLQGLVRTAVGEFTLARALSLEAVEALAREGRVSEALIPLSEALPEMPALRLSERDLWRVRHGHAIPGRGLPHRTYVRLLDGRDQLVAVGENRPEQGVIQPRVVLEP
jgi:tRNA pseudouridine55 synthase